MSKALKEHADTPSGIPGFAQAQAWLGADLFLHGLELAGCNASKADFMSKLRADGTWNAGGLYPSPHDFRVPTPATQCSYISTLKGNGFVPEPKASPICGKEISS
jgi:branched-chain amino acid transport system substrate-binding protein